MPATCCKGSGALQVPEFKITRELIKVSWVIVTARDAEEAEFAADIEQRWIDEPTIDEWTTEEL